MSTPAYPDFGKQVNDLLNKKYSTKYFNVTSKYAAGVTAETSLTLNQNKPVESGLKLNYKSPKWWGAELDTDFTTSGGLKETIKFTKLVDFLTVKFGLANKFHDKPFFQDEKESKEYQQQCTSTLGLDYDTKVSGVTVKVGSNVTTKWQCEGSAANSSIVEINGVVGQDGLSTGGSVTLTHNKQTANGEARPLIHDASLGVHYNTSDYSIGFTSSNWCQALSLTQFLNFSKDYQLGSQFDWNIVNRTSSLSIGSSYKLDANTLLKVKSTVGNDTKGDLFNATGLIEYAVSKEVKVGATAALNFASPTPFTPTAFGVSVTLGDQ